MDKITAKLEKAIEKTTCWEESVELVMQSIKEIKRLRAENKLLKTKIDNRNSTIHHLRKKAEFDMPASMRGHYHNACTDSCDMIDGPCACGAWHNAKEWITKLNKHVQKLQAELQQQKNDNIDVEDDVSWHKAIFDGSWPQAVEILERTLIKVKEIQKKS